MGTASEAYIDGSCCQDGLVYVERLHHARVFDVLSGNVLRELFGQPVAQGVGVAGSLSLHEFDRGRVGGPLGYREIHGIPGVTTLVQRW